MTGQDPRTGPADSGTVRMVDADDDTPQTALDIPSDALFRLDGLTIDYDRGATATIDLAIFDDGSGTTAGNVSDRRDTIRNIDPGESVALDYDGMRDFENDVLVQAINGNQDGDVDVTVEGTRLTVLADVEG